MTITIFVPAAMQRDDDAFDFVRRARIEARRRLVQEKDLGAQRPHPRQREPLLLAARQHARGAVRLLVEADLGQRLACAVLARFPMRRRRASAHRSRCRAPFAAASSAAGTPSPGAAVRLAPPAQYHLIVPAVGASRPWHRRSSTLLPAPFGPSTTVRGPRAIVIETPSMIRCPPASNTTSSSRSGSRERGARMPASIVIRIGAAPSP